jgi:epoxide hydrolase 4
VVETFQLALPHGITLSCRAAGAPDAPLLVFLHGFPEAAFVWDELLLHFADRYRCVAPNLRGFEASSAPQEVEAYRAKPLVADITALIDALGGRAEAVVAHDWGGAIAWTLAVQQPRVMKRLVIVNAPHPATFLREMQHNPAQRAASAYMNFLCRPDAEALLAQDDFARLWPFFTGGKVGGAPWLTDATKDQYRAVWRAGLAGGCNLYRASPLRPPTAADQGVMALAFAPEAVTVTLPTLVVWGEDDVALPPALLEGLQAFVPSLALLRVAGASHWIVHERGPWLAAQIDHYLAATQRA